jgi:hypothetical protein
MMFPMVSSLDELNGALALCAEVEKELHRKRRRARPRLEIGINDRDAELRVGGRLPGRTFEVLLGRPRTT